MRGRWEENGGKKDEDDELTINPYTRYLGVHHPPPRPHPPLKTFPPPTDEVTLSYKLAVKWVFLTTTLIAFLSDVLVSTIETFTSDLGINPVFVAAVVVPIMGNAAEHGASVIFAVRGKMDISIAICVGSSIQISLCVLPACVLLGWVCGREFTMFFDGYETVCLLISVAVVSFFLQGGTSNWMAGVMMGGVYGMMAMGFWVHEKEEGEWGEEE